MHLAVRIPSLFGQLVPRFWLGQQFADGPLREAQNEFGKQSLAYVVYTEQFANSSGYVQGIEGIVCEPVHVESDEFV